VDGGFPETKELKRRVRDVIEPGRDLGHVDRQHGGDRGKHKQEDAQAVETVTSLADDAVVKEAETCEDCK
jgi:hypothetical protein